MQRTIRLCSLLLCFACPAMAQDGVEAILGSIAENNQRLAAGEDYRSARQIEYRTGLAPANPTVEYDYLNGRPASAGNQTDIVIAQAFDFPTAYIHRNRIAGMQSGQLTFEETALRREVLLEAKLACLEVIFLNKRIAALSDRAETATRMLEDYQARFERQDVSVLEVNKARLQALKIEKELALSQSERLRQLEKLQQLNGGKAVPLPDTIYPRREAVPEFSELEPIIEAADPDIGLLKSRHEITESRIKLSKALALPKIEAGYHYQSILQQRFSGIHLGISIPLWERKNTVKLQRAEKTFLQSEIQAHLTDHFHETKRLYQQYEALKENVARYRQALSGINSEMVLRRSLELGELSFIEYALEIEYLYDSEDTLLELEKQYHQTIAQLYKFEL